MDEYLERIFRIYHPRSHEEFLGALRDLRFADPNWLYEAGVGADPSPWQGDVCLDDIALSYSTEGAAEAIMVEGPAVVLSHGCDVVVGQGDMCTLAPVFDVAALEGRIENPETRASRVDSLRKNRTSGLFYLPAAGALATDSYVDFSYAASIPTPDTVRIFTGLGGARRLRLTRPGWHLFTGKLAHHFARLEEVADYPRSAA